MTESSDRPQPLAIPAFASPRVIAAGAGVAAVLALSIAAQTYLSMLGHGHSFRRMLAWQLATWAFWACAAPFVLRRGAEFMARRPRTLADAVPLVWLGTLLLAVHSVLSAQLTMWIQPFVPVETYNLVQAWAVQLPARFAIDLFAYGLLIALGGALWTHRRAQELEVRESRLETELARAQLHALRLEIEPHFLFNTLNAITALVRLKDNSRAVEMLVGLGDFMRSNLDRPHDQLVTLATEIAWAQRYIALQQARFGERLEVEYQIADECLEYLVPTLLLQPIVENAFRHGLGRTDPRLLSQDVRGPATGRLERLRSPMTAPGCRPISTSIARREPVCATCARASATCMAMTPTSTSAGPETSARPSPSASRFPTPNGGPAPPHDPLSRARGRRRAAREEHGRGAPARGQRDRDGVRMRRLREPRTS